MKLAALLCCIIVMCARGLAQEQPSSHSDKKQLAIGRLTFFDFGPPSEYYELFLVEQTGVSSSSVRRIMITPPGQRCITTAKLEYAESQIQESVDGLLRHVDPCKIPQKKLANERKRRRKHPVFSGANVVMEVRCGEQNRLVQTSILDRDWFAANPKTPVYTSWTSDVLADLSKDLGPSVMEKPSLPLPDPPVSENKSPQIPAEILHGIEKGDYDGLFPGTDEKLSELYRLTTERLPSPTVSLVSITPLTPLTFSLPEYPLLGRYGAASASVRATLSIDDQGNVIRVERFQGSKIFSGAVEAASRGWKFPKRDESAEIGQQPRVVEVVIDFERNCN